MKHLVTISLVFFSLTHLAKAEQRVDKLRVVAEVYCNRQQVTLEQLFFGENHPTDGKHHLFLSNNELAVLGAIDTDQVAVQFVPNHIIAYLTIRHNAKNNSP